MAKRKAQKQKSGRESKKQASMIKMGAKEAQKVETKKPGRPPKTIEENEPEPEIVEQEEKSVAQPKAGKFAVTRKTKAKKSSNKKNLKPTRHSQRSKPTINYNLNQRPVKNEPVKKVPAKKIEPHKTDEPTTSGLQQKKTAAAKKPAETKQTVTEDVPKAYQFKITVMGGIDPPIWRRIQVPEEYHFGNLGYAIKSAMGWISCHHVHGFYAPAADGVGTDFIKHPDPDLKEFNKEQIDEKTVTLSDRFKEKGDRVIYSYTFGEAWEHYVQLEEIVPRVANKEYPCILAGKRACPTEDIGGIDQFLTLCDVLKNCNHPERQEYMDWLADYSLTNYNPNKFNIREIEFVNCPIYKGKSRAVHHIVRG